MAPDSITVPSVKREVSAPLERLVRFCDSEYAYYDGIPSANPNAIEPIDVLVTAAMNSSIRSAQQMRRIHQGMAAACDRLLEAIPRDASLPSFDPTLGVVRELLHAAIQVPGVLTPVATKVLHRKRPALIPMLDNVLLWHYLEGKRWGETQAKAQAAAVAVDALAMFKEDLASCYEQLLGLSMDLARRGYPLTPVRMLEILVWTESEERGYYR